MHEHVIICGAPRSASTLAYNIVLALYSVQRPVFARGLLDVLDLSAKSDFEDLDGVSIYKTHSIPLAIKFSEKKRSTLIYTTRRPSAIGISGIKMFGWSLSEALHQAEKSVVDLRDIRRMNIITLVYPEDAREFVIGNYLDELIAQLGLDMPCSQKLRILNQIALIRPPSDSVAKKIKRRLRRMFRRRRTLRAIYRRFVPKLIRTSVHTLLRDHDVETLLHPSHITSQAKIPEGITANLVSALAEYDAEHALLGKGCSADLIEEDGVAKL